MASKKQELDIAVNLDTISENQELEQKTKKIDSDMEKWVKGDLVSSPAEINKMITEFEKKSLMSVAFVTIDNMLDAQTTIKPFIKAMQAEIYDINKIDTSDTEGMLKIMKQATQDYASTVETARKFIHANRGAFSMKTEKEEELSALISSLTSEAQEKLIETIKEQSNSPVSELEE